MAGHRVGTTGENSVLISARSCEPSLLLGREINYLYTRRNCKCSVCTVTVVVVTVCFYFYETGSHQEALTGLKLALNLETMYLCLSSAGTKGV